MTEMLKKRIYANSPFCCKSDEEIWEIISNQERWDEVPIREVYIHSRVSQVAGRMNCLGKHSVKANKTIWKKYCKYRSYINNEYGGDTEQSVWTDNRTGAWEVIDKLKNRGECLETLCPRCRKIVEITSIQRTASIGNPSEMGTRCKSCNEFFALTDLMLDRILGI